MGGKGQRGGEGERVGKWGDGEVGLWLWAVQGESRGMGRWVGVEGGEK